MLSNNAQPTSYVIISKETCVAYGSVRNAIRSFVKNGIIMQPILYRQGSTQGFTFKFSKRIKLNVQTNEQASEQTSENTQSLIRKKDRFFLKNLSFSNFWIKQGLTKKKFNIWIKEFDFSEDEWKDQFTFGEYEPKVQNANNPINYFYKSLKQGGLTRPDGFEFPEERKVRIQKENLEAKKKALKEAKKLQEQEKELANKESFIYFLADKEAIKTAIMEIEKDSFISKKLILSISFFKSTEKVNSNLERRLKRWMEN